MSLFKSSLVNTLYNQTWPMLVGLFAIMGSQLVDSAFIGQLGTQPLAVLGFTIPVYQLIVGFQVGLGIATTATISTALGANKHSYAKFLGTIVLAIGIASISLLCILLWSYQEQVAYALGANKALLITLRHYWLPWLISCWLGAMLYFGYSICRSHGETLLPGKVMVSTSVLNVILDPLFIFTFDMGLAGAAWATCVSFLIGCIFIFKAILRNQYIVMLCTLDKVKEGVQAILTFTAPAMLGQFIPPISAMIVTVVVASYGDFAIGAWGLANRIEFIAIILILALTMALPPIIGKLKGQNDIEKIYRLVKIAIHFVILIQLILALIILAIANPVAHLLTTETTVATQLQQYLYLVPISYGALGVCMISVSACNAMGLPTAALGISILRLFVCYLPLIWLGSEMFGLTGLFIGATLGNFLSGLSGWLMFVKQYDKLAFSSAKKHIFPSTIILN